MTFTQKQWATAKAQAALQGYALARTDPTDGPVAYYLERSGLVQLILPKRLAQMFAGEGLPSHANERPEYGALV